jgi:hypothetical protein
MSFRRMRHVKAREVHGCTANFDANVPTSLYDATTGGSLVAADGAVARWEDISGNGNHVTQATSGNRPLRRVASRFGKDILQTNSTNSCLQAASFYPSSGANNFTIIYSGEENSSIAYPCMFEYGQNNNGRRVSGFLKYDVAGRTVVDFFNSYIGNSSNLTGGSYAIHAVISAGATTTDGTSQQVNGKDLTENYTNNPSTTLNVGTGVPLILMSNSVKNTPAGKLGYFASWSRALNNSTLARVTGSQLRKYGVKQA